MKKTIIIYRSRYGYTKRYAQWIAEELHCPVKNVKQIKPAILADFDTIIFGGGLYAGGVGGISLLTKNARLLQSKNIILFTCGLADPTDPTNVSSIRTSLSRVLPPEMQKNMTIFHLRGGIDYFRLSLVHKAMMAMMHRMLLRKETLRAEDREFLKTYGRKVDFTDHSTISAVADAARRFA